MLKLVVLDVQVFDVIWRSIDKDFGVFK